MVKYFFLVILSGIFLIATPTSAHPGNTDSRGGHTCRTNCEKWGYSYGEYHYHGGSTKKTIAPSVTQKQKSKIIKKLNNTFQTVKITETNEGELTIQIPKGTESICIWRYTTGPIKTHWILNTRVVTSSESHHLKLDTEAQDFSTYCFDNLGNNYTGKI